MTTIAIIIALFVLYGICSNGNGHLSDSTLRRMADYNRPRPTPQVFRTKTFDHNSGRFSKTPKRSKSRNRR